MKRQQALRRRLVTLHTLTEAVGAMRSLSAHHFRIARAAVGPARAYRDEVIAAVGALQLEWEGGDGAPCVLLITADLGLCGDYSSRVASELGKRRIDGPVYTIGNRGRAALARLSVTPVEVYPAPTSVAGITHLLINIVEDLVAGFAEGRIGSLTVLSARFDGAGKFTPVWTPVIPIHAPQAGPIVTTPYADHARLVEIAVREYLHISLYELVLDALAAEHGMRLVSTEAARRWLEDASDRTARLLGASRREESTQELLDIVSAARPLRKRFADVS